jgi:hypothetical protein
VEETLDSLQLVYRILVTLSIGILVLVTSFKSKPGPYQAAYDELRALRATLSRAWSMREDLSRFRDYLWLQSDHR